MMTDNFLLLNPHHKYLSEMSHFPFNILSFWHMHSIFTIESNTSVSFV